MAMLEAMMRIIMATMAKDSNMKRIAMGVESAKVEVNQLGSRISNTQNWVDDLDKQRSEIHWVPDDFDNARVGQTGTPGKNTGSKSPIGDYVAGFINSMDSASHACTRIGAMQFQPQGPPHGGREAPGEAMRGEGCHDFDRGDAIARAAHAKPCHQLRGTANGQRHGRRKRLERPRQKGQELRGRRREQADRQPDVDQHIQH